MSTKRWFAWVIKRNRLENVVGYIKESVPEVDQYFYPRIKKEYENKRGTKVKDRPLYEGYIFLHYDNPMDVYHKLNKYPFITTFAGEVSDQEIRQMEEVQGKLLSEIKSSKFSKGDNVLILTGPFKGFEAAVLSIRADQIKVNVDAKILGQQGVDLLFTDDQLEHISNLTATSVQNII
jgi:transcription antitermination factor NusG